MKSNNSLVVDGLSKKYQEVSAVDGISFSISKGEVVALLGESGAGKSTILRCIAGLTAPDKGQVMIDDVALYKETSKGVEVNKNTKRDYLSKLGLVFQHFNLFPHMTVMGNVMEALVNVKGMAKEEAVALAEEWLTYVGMQEHKSKYPFQLSGGQKQRVAIVRACVLKPKVLMFDEPTSALDPATSIQVAKLLKELAHKNDMGILVITHDIPFAEAACDRVLNLKNGLIV